MVALFLERKLLQRKTIARVPDAGVACLLSLYRNVLDKDLRKKLKTFQDGERLDSQNQALTDKIANRAEKVEATREELKALKEEFEKNTAKRQQIEEKKTLEIIRK